MSILYITSFNSKLYDLTGERLINTFKETKSEGDLFCYIEDFPNDISTDRIIVESMDKDPFYKKWFDANRDLIPKEQGGYATLKNKPMAFRPENIRTSQWTKKIATMNYALKNMTADYDYFMWVDCDCFFTSKFDEEALKAALGDKSFCYHLGKDRERKGLGVETGLLGFRNDKNSKKVLDRWIRKYSGPGFRQYDKWNDAHMFHFILKENEKLARQGKDLVTNYESTGRARSHVIIRGDLGDYFDHEKGLHKRNL